MWHALTEQECRERWCFASGDCDQFPYAVAAYETFTDGRKLKWLNDQGIDHRLSYDGHQPAHHLYRFRDEVSAKRFSKAFSLELLVEAANPSLSSKTDEERFFKPLTDPEAERLAERMYLRWMEHEAAIAEWSQPYTIRSWADLEPDIQRGYRAMAEVALVREG